MFGAVEGVEVHLAFTDVWKKKHGVFGLLCRVLNGLRFDTENGCFTFPLDYLALHGRRSCVFTLVESLLLVMFMRVEL
jgi:hypothetical protein